MGKGLGALVFVAGVAGLGYWGTQSYAVTIQSKIAAEAETTLSDTVHPVTAAVSGRDITLSGVADTDEELAAILAAVDAVPGRRVVNAEAVTTLPAITPYTTAIAKGADGSFATTGYAPTEVQKDAVAEAHPSIANLPLGHGAPPNWSATISAGFDALDALEEGSMSLTGTTITLAGIAATPAHSTTARAALAGLEGVDTVVALDVLDPGIVDFQLRYDAATGFRLDGTVPELPGRDGFSVALGGVTLDGIGDTTFATVNGLDTVLAGLAAYLASLDRADLSGTNAGLRVLAQPMAGLDAGTIERLLADALGPTAELSILPSQAPKAGDERRNTATGRVQFAAGGVWLNRPEFEPTGSACTAAARATVEAAPIRFQTGTADLDPASLHTINEVAGIVHHCTQAPGARVTIGGHTDSEGNDAANYALSVARAKAVRDALWDRGVPATRMMPIGYGETEPIAANETAEGRARNRRISFEWPE